MNTKSQSPDAPGDFVPGKLGGEFDSQLRPGSPSPDAGNPEPASHRKAAQPTSDTGASLTPPPEEEQLTLPRGALVAMRKSGGLRFNSRQVVVYRSRRVTVEDQVSGEQHEPTRPRYLSKKLVADLRRLVELADFSAAPGRHSPDAYAYEIVARLGRNTASATAFDGSIPDSLAPLIQALSRLLSPDP